MSFPFLVSNTFFWWLLAAGIPIVVHLLNRRRHRVVQWAAMDFLLKATQESKGKKRLKHFIILACRALAIAMLVLAVARPLLSNGLLGWGSNKVDTVILVLDRSSSMEQDSSNGTLSKREQAIALVQETLKNLDSSSQLVLIDSATGAAQTIPSPSVLHTISQTQPTDSASNIPSLLSAAIEYVLDQDTGRTEIWLASDMQLTDWQNTSNQWAAIRTGLDTISEQASLRVLSLNETAEDNHSISIERAQRVGDELLLEIAVSQSGSSTATTLTLSHNGVQSELPVELAGATTYLNHRIALQDQSGFGFLKLPSDQNTRDNTQFFSYSADLAVRTAIVAENNESAYYLGLAAAPPSYANQQSKRYSPNDVLPYAELSHISWLAPLPSGEQKEHLLHFIEQGGTVSFFAPTETNQTNAESFLNTQWGLINKAAQGKFFIIEDWSRNDGPLRNGEDGRSIALTKLKAIQSRELTTPHTELASWTNGTPFLVRAIHGQGAAYFFSTQPDYSWSNLADADVILPAMQRLVLQGNQRFGSGLMATVGALPAHLQIDAAGMQRLDSATENDPLNHSFTAGVYRIGERTIAINRPPSEDESLLLSPAQLDQLLTETPYTLFENQQTARASANLQLWQPLLLLMLLLMISEAILCLNTKRVSTH